MVERDQTLLDSMEEETDDIVIGDVAESRVIRRAGIEEAVKDRAYRPGSESVNIFLAVYCRKLNPERKPSSSVVSPTRERRGHPQGRRVAGVSLPVRMTTVPIDSWRQLAGGT